MTKVIFRKFSDGDVIALFPTIPGDVSFLTCESYQHIGQHGAAAEFITTSTKPAKPEEYAPLLAELQAIGYDDLKIAKRFTWQDRQARLQALRAIRTAN
jgi:hypothetical protein